MPTNKQDKNLKILLSIGLTLLTIGVAVFFFINQGDSPTTSNEDDNGAIVFAAIWPAIMIPIIMKNKKKQGLTKREIKTQKHLLIALTITLILGIISLLVVTLQ